jgi:hypothetical protein
VAKRDTIIEVNGKRYDAVTGKLLGASTSRKSTGAVIDGIAKKPRRAASAVPAADSVHRKAERSKTLMRTAVKKPASSKRPIHAKNAHVAPTSKPVKATHAQPTGKIAPARIERAQLTPKSLLISKFGQIIPVAPGARLEILPVKDTPLHAPPIATTNHAKAVINPFHHAIERAVSHTQPRPAKVRAHHKVAQKFKLQKGSVRIGSAALSVLLLVGFFGYQNMPNLNMRVASAKAGVRGDIPGYQPAGFSLNGPIQSTAGQITISYKSNSDERNFQITQRKTDWNSEALLKNHVATNSRPYQSYQDNEKTIYIYDGGNASWVDGGVWYEIAGKEALSSDQLIRMANSL